MADRAMAIHSGVPKKVGSGSLGILATEGEGPEGRRRSESNMPGSGLYSSSVRSVNTSVSDGQVVTAVLAPAVVTLAPVPQQLPVAPALLVWCRSAPL